MNVFPISKVYGAIQKVCLSPRGGRGLTKMMTKCDIGGRGSEPKSDVTSSKTNVSEIVFLMINALYYHHSIDILM